jgi:Holliday junction resolvase-like predicted endonuclease
VCEGVDVAVRQYLSGNSSALDCLRRLGFIEAGEPASRGYVLYKALKVGINVINHIKRLDWKEFEEFIGHVFAEFGFHVATNLRLDCNGGVEFDIVAWNKEIVLVVEAKKWKGGGGKWAEVADRHIEKISRCRSKLLAFAPSIAPLVVTSTDTGFIHRGVPVIPVDKLGHFLASFHDIKNKIAILT